MKKWTKKTKVKVGSVLYKRHLAGKAEEWGEEGGKKKQRPGTRRRG
jgi:hypothetical protein